jgi:hypothetical protein
LNQKLSSEGRNPQECIFWQPRTRKYKTHDLSGSLLDLKKITEFSIFNPNLSSNYWLRNKGAKMEKISETTDWDTKVEAGLEQCV